MNSLDVSEAPVGTKLSGTYQVMPENQSGDEADDLEVTEHAPLPEQADDNSNSLKCEDNNQHENVTTNSNLESRLFQFLLKLVDFLSNENIHNKCLCRMK